MKFLVLSLLVLAGCGYSSKDNELTGQVKRVGKLTPMLCDPWTTVDVSLGLMRNGTGSVSKEDLFLTVTSADDEKALKAAAELGTPVKITYNVKRFTWCTEDHFVTKVELLK